MRNDAPTAFDPVATDPSNVANVTLGLWNFEEGSGTGSDDAGADALDATLPSGGVWNNALDDAKPAIYAINYIYDKVGNRTNMVKMNRTGSPTAERWIYTYNDLNQLTLRQQYSILYSSGSTGFVNKWVYTYDDNGNVVVMSRQNVSSVQQDKWSYTWNPRDQMTKAEKKTGAVGSEVYAGKVEYRYCLACDGALSERIEYSPTASTTIVSWKRHEYDGLNLVRVDERYPMGNALRNEGGVESGPSR